LAWLGFPAHRLTGLRFATLRLTRLGIVHRQLFAGLLRQSLSLTFSLSSQLLQSLSCLGLGFGRSLGVVLPHRLFRSVRSVLGFGPRQRSGPLRQISNRPSQFLLRASLLLHRLLEPLGVLGILSQGLIGILLQFGLLPGQFLRLLGQGIQLRNPRLARSHFVLLILLSSASHLWLILSRVELLSQGIQSLRGVRLLLSRLLHCFLQLRRGRSWFVRVRRRSGLLLGELLHLLLSLGRFRERLLGRLLLGLGLRGAPQFGQLLLTVSQIVHRLGRSFRCWSLRDPRVLLGRLCRSLLFLRQSLRSFTG
jgi:hypothetical protein